MINLKNPNTKTYLILTLFTAIDAALRLYQIGFQCLWTEEQYTLQISQLPVVELIQTSLTLDINPPLFYILSHFSLVLSGFGDGAIRYPSVIAGILAIPAIYYLGKTVKNELTGLICAGLTAILFPLIYYSQFGRAYALEFLFFVLLLIIFVQIKRGDTHSDKYLIFSILAALNLWTHLLSVIPVSLLILDLILTKKGLKSVGSALVTGILCIPLIQIPLTLLQSRLTTQGQTWGMKLNEILIITPTELLGSLFPVLIPLAGLGLWQERKNKIVLKLVVISIITVIAGLVLSFYTPFFPRYYLEVSAVLILLVGIACTNLIQPIKSENIKLLLIVWVTILFLVLSWNQIWAHFTVQRYVC